MIRKMASGVAVALGPGDTRGRGEAGHIHSMGQGSQLYEGQVFC